MKNIIEKIIRETEIDMLMQDKEFNKKLKKAMKQKAGLHIDLNEKYGHKVMARGSVMGILLALASLEDAVFNKYDVPVELFEAVKRSIGTREV